MLAARFRSLQSLLQMVPCLKPVGQAGKAVIHCRMSDTTLAFCYPITHRVKCFGQLAQFIACLDKSRLGVVTDLDPSSSLHEILNRPGHCTRQQYGSHQGDDQCQAAQGNDGQAKLAVRCHRFMKRFL